MVNVLGTGHAGNFNWSRYELHTKQASMRLRTFAKVDSMKQALVDEWVRLNPKFVRAEDGVWDTIEHAARETLHGFFAPLLLLKWIVQRAFKTMLGFR